MSRLKICGLKRPEDIDYVNEHLPDYIGFVFAKSARQVTDGQALELKKRLEPGILSVGVFVNGEMDRIVSLLEAGIIDLIQLHGQESIGYVKRLQKETGRLRTKERGRIIKAIRVLTLEDVEKGLDYPADYLLFDTYKKGQYGGSGECFDWQLLKGIDRPFFLAGGLKAENIENALEMVNPYCLDLSSGVETAGVKDAKKIKNVVEKVRNRVC